MNCIRLLYNLTSGELPSLQLWAFLSTGKLIYRQFLRWLDKVSQSCSGSCFPKKKKIGNFVFYIVVTGILVICVGFIRLKNAALVR